MPFRANDAEQVFLLTYAGVNFACFLLDAVGVPNFRPTFRYYNRYVCFIGFAGCLFTMFASDWRMALAACGLFMACVVIILLRNIPNK